jgi:hypothetical protein
MQAASPAPDPRVRFELQRYHQNRIEIAFLTVTFPRPDSHFLICFARKGLLVYICTPLPAAHVCGRPAPPPLHSSVPLPSSTTSSPPMRCRHCGGDGVHGYRKVPQSMRNMGRRRVTPVLPAKRVQAPAERGCRPGLLVPTVNVDLD